MASLTVRTADETMAKTKALLPAAADPLLAKGNLPPTGRPGRCAIRAKA